MRKLADVSIKRPVFATMIIMALVVVGTASYFRLGVDRFPSVDLPTVSVRVELPGASTEEIETQVVQKLEEQINTIQGIQELRSIASPGNALVIAGRPGEGRPGRAEPAARHPPAGDLQVRQ